MPYLFYKNGSNKGSILSVYEPWFSRFKSEITSFGIWSLSKPSWSISVFDFLLTITVLWRAFLRGEIREDNKEKNPRRELLENVRTLLVSHSLVTLQGKSHLCFPFLGIARPQSKFPHSCVCERFINSQDLSIYFHAAE